MFQNPVGYHEHIAGGIENFPYEESFLMNVYYSEKLDGVGPLITDTLTTSSATLPKKLNIKKKNFMIRNM